MPQPNAKSGAIQRRITLIRHAKAQDDGGPDVARKLNTRGEQDAAALGQWMKERRALPELFLCSTATRTRQTLAAFNSITATILSERLYLASAPEILKLLHEMDDAVTHLAVVGHNPGLHQLAAMLVGEYTDDADAERLMLKFPTSACAVLSVPLARWCDLREQTAMLETYQSARA